MLKEATAEESGDFANGVGVELMGAVDALALGSCEKLGRSAKARDSDVKDGRALCVPSVPITSATTTPKACTAATC